MRADILIKINNDKKQKEYLMNNSYWYKYLNRSRENYNDFLKAFKNYNRVSKVNKTNELVNTFDTVNTILKILK